MTDPDATLDPAHDEAAADPPHERQGWLFEPLPDGEAQRGPRRLGRGLAALLHLPEQEPDEAPGPAPAAFAPGSVIQLSSCAEDEFEVPLEPASAPPSPPAPEPVAPPVPAVEPGPPPDAPGQTYLVDDEVLGFELPDVEME